MKQPPLKLPEENDWPAWMKFARGELGVTEVPGKGINHRIAEYYESTKGAPPHDDAVPWCAAFACWCLEQAGIESPRSRAARSFMKWGMPLPELRFGALVVFSADNRGPGAGHVAFVAGKRDTKTIWVLGGNQANRVSYQARPLENLLGYRWP